MLNEENYSSDSSDEDYIPTGAESDVEELTDEPEHSSSSDGDQVVEHGSVSKKQKLCSKKKKKLKPRNSAVQDKEDKIKTIYAAEDNKERVDSLWASFKDVSELKKAKEIVTPSIASPATSKIYEFAGEKIEISEKNQKIASISSQEIKGKRPALRAGGLSSLTSQLSNKKSKLSTLEKSKLDWDKFKHDEGIAEDLKSFNQGKKGFLERQAFLERADVKQFEIEKTLRAGRKSNS
ncbi:craniofacial development protein 1-like [Daphnia carinata]|uniref:craniofacial development protein 1-like n=1 Tax=Daphnia carinata TaxID=120202 RepID=UPI002580E09B|nr:craniofacial development protein 1-like [Daphnia carinata]